MVVDEEVNGGHILFHLCQIKSLTAYTFPKVLLPSKKTTKTRHNDNYEITSFVYKARRPFNPTRFHGDFLDPFFVVIEEEEEDEEGEEEEEEKGETRASDDKEMTSKADSRVHMASAIIKKCRRKRRRKWHSAPLPPAFFR